MKIEVEAGKDITSELNAVVDDGSRVATEPTEAERAALMSRTSGEATVATGTGLEVATGTE